MGLKYSDIESIDYNRKIEIIERAIFIKEKCKKLLEGKGSYGLTYMLQTLYYQYRKLYKDDLTEAEHVIFNLYSIFPNNESFNNLVVRYEKDFKRIGSFYQVTEPYVKIRYYIGKEIEAEKKNNITLEKKPN